MLVLSRKVGEEIIIDDTIRITVAEIGNGRVKIGITAPREVHIKRAELDATPADADLHEVFATRKTKWAGLLAPGRDVRTSPLPR